MWFSSPLELALRNAEGIDEDLGEYARNWMVTNLLFDPSLNLATPFLEAFMSGPHGRDSFTNAPIVPNRLQSEDRVDQTDVYTSATADTLAKGAKAVGLGNTKAASPKIIDHLIDGYFPTVGSQGVGVAERALGQGKNKPAGKDRDPITDIWRQFKIEGEGRNTPLIGDLIDSRDKYNKAAKKAGGADNLDGPTAYAREQVNKGYKEFSDVSSEITKVTNSDEFSPEEKRTLLNHLIEQRNQIIRRLNDDDLFSFIR